MLQNGSGRYNQVRLYDRLFWFFHADHLEVKPVRHLGDKLFLYFGEHIIGKDPLDWEETSQGFADLHQVAARKTA